MQRAVFKTAAELTLYRIKGYRGRGLAVCELVYIRSNSSCRYGNRRRRAVPAGEQERRAKAD
jgi:hypothetical protein